MRERRQQQSGSAADKLKPPSMLNIILCLTLALRTGISGIWVMEWFGVYLSMWQLTSLLQQLARALQNELRRLVRSDGTTHPPYPSRTLSLDQLVKELTLCEGLKQFARKQKGTGTINLKVLLNKICGDIHKNPSSTQSSIN